jgi:peptidoglycan/xylan/chitin deacetylase (PgdA/CDA1 family)
MFGDAFCGLSLPSKTICLTFDDGPWTQTVAIGEFLHSQSVPATFFVLGSYARRRPDTLGILNALGHTVANHAECHVRLTELPEDEAITNVVSAHKIICSSIHGECTFFRPPFGAWSPELSVEANRTDVLAHCIGPIHWDINGQDWCYWNHGQPVSECVNHYIAEINRQQRGIVLMHDGCSDPNQQPDKNKCLELIKTLVPALRRYGYQFVDLNKVPEIGTAITSQ